MMRCVSNPSPENVGASRRPRPVPAAPATPRGALAAPHPMVEGTEDGDYYRGAVTGVTREQIDWVRAHRPEDPTLESAKPVPAPTPAKEAVRR